MAKNKAGSLDTNTLLRLVLGDVPEQADKVEKLLESGGIFEVSDITIIEMVFVLEKVYHLPRLQVADNIKAIIQHSQIDCNKKLFYLVLPIYIEHSKLSIVDCALAKYAELNKAVPLYTFDTDLASKCPESTQLI